MRILLLAHGNSVHTSRFVNLLLESGQSVVHVDQYDTKPESAGHYTFVPYPSLPTLERSRLRGAFRLGRWFKRRQLRRIYQRFRPDVVHVHWVDERAIQAARAGLSPLVLTCLGSDINNLFAPDYSNSRYRRELGEALARANAVTADTVEVLERCEELARHRLNTRLFYFGINISQFRNADHAQAQELRQRLNLPEYSKFILSPRALRPLMNHEYVLDAFARVVGSRQDHSLYLGLIRYLPFGDAYETNLRARSLELGLGEQVLWLDPVPNDVMPIYYSAADLIVNYPERDGLPVTFFEAAAAFRPLVTSDLRAYKGLFSSGFFYSAPPRDSGALACAFEEWLDEEEAQRAVRLDHAHATVSALADGREATRRILEIYTSVKGSQIEL